MNRIIRYFITYPIWANLLMLVVIALGFVLMGRMRTSFFPEVEVNVISISVLYPGTSPEEIEESVVLRIETNLRGIAGVERITSSSRENSASISIEVVDHYDVDKVYTDVRNAVDRISPWPAGAERPVIVAGRAITRTISVALSGDADLWALKSRAEQFRDELLALEGISQVAVTGIPDREIAITVSEEALRRYQLSFADLAAAVASANVDLSAGSIRTESELILIRLYGKRDFAHEIRSIVVRSLPNGGVVRLDDIAQVQEQWDESPDATYLNGKRAVIVDIDKTNEEDILAVAQLVRDHAQDFAASHPEIDVTVISDATVALKQRIDLLVRNGITGFILVILVLSMFLNARLSFWVAAGIPFSFAGMFIIAYMWGITINVISLMGMIIVVGILVDDAIVVAESIYQKHELGLNPLQAAIQGLSEVIAPVFTAVCTTIIAFIPFFFFLGTMGKFIYQLALVVIGTLIFSLVESIFILPAHLAHSRAVVAHEKVSAFRTFFDSLYRFITDRLYGPSLRWCMDNTLFTALMPVAFVLITIGLLRGGIVEFSAFPYMDRDDISMNLTLTTGTRELVTDSILAAMETTIFALGKEMATQRKDGKEVVLSIRRTVGSNSLGDRGGHAGRLDIELLDAAARNIPAFEIQNRVRKALGSVPESQKLSFGGGRWGKAISISLTSNDLAQLDKARKLLKEKLAEYPSLGDITDSEVEGWREIRLALKPAALAAGLTEREIAAQVRSAFFGSEVQRFQRGEDQILVWVRLSDTDRASLGKLEQMRIRAKNGALYPLQTVADYTIERGRVAIAHVDGKREISVEADLVNPEQSVSSMLSDIKENAVPAVLSQVENVFVSYTGRERDNIKFIRSLQGSFPLALMGIAVILVLVFRSPWQATLIFLMIPLGLLGAVWGHLVHGFMISRLSMFGAVALAGMVINDSIVFIDQINRNLKKGLPVRDAVFGAGTSRLRPIILTTVTTVAGMAPLIFENSRQARFLTPMAVSLCYGLVFGSLFILYVIPAFFLILNKTRFLYERLFDPLATRESVEPAVREMITERQMKLEATV